LLKSLLGQHVFAAGDLDQFGHPADAADDGIVPLLKIDFWLWSMPGCRCNFDKPLFETGRKLIGALRYAYQRTERADHRHDACDVALVKDVDGDAGAHQFGDDVCLQVGESQHEVRRQRQNLRNVCRDEGRDPRLLAAHLRRPHRIAGNADDAILLAEQIERLHGLFGQADDSAGRELAHGRTYAEIPVACHDSHYVGGHCLNYPDHPFS